MTESKERKAASTMKTMPRRSPKVNCEFASPIGPYDPSRGTRSGIVDAKRPLNVAGAGEDNVGESKEGRRRGRVSRSSAHS